MPGGGASDSSEPESESESAEPVSGAAGAAACVRPSRTCAGGWSAAKGVKNYQDVRVNDQIECFARVEVARTLQ